MALWRDAKIRTKISVALLVAMLGLVGFAGVVVGGKQHDAAASARIRMLSVLSIKTGDLLHETQRERGRTAQFTSSRGTRFGAELAAQQRVTDQRLADLRAYLTGNAGALPPAVRTSVDRLQAAVDRLAGLRSQAAGLATAPAQIIAGYTAMNQVLLGTVADAAGENGNPTVAVRLQAYLGILSAKEAAGQERAQLATVFTVGHFAEGQFSTVISLISAQQAYLTVFTRAGSPTALAKWSDVQASPAVAQVATFEKRAIDRAPTGGFGVDPSAWFDAATAKVDLCKNLENLQATEILGLAGAAERQANQAARVSLLLAVVLLCGTAAIAVGVVVSITRPLRQVTDIAERMAVGDVSQEVGYRSGNELGRLADSFRKLSEYVGETAALAAALAEGNLTRTVAVRGEQDLLGNAMQATIVQLRDLAGRIKGSGLRLSGSAEELAGVSAALTENSAQTASMAGTVSAATEEMTASIAEISRGVAETAAVAAEAVARAQRAEQVVTSLEGATGEISDVVNLIQAIASQTNLLALNATIEAARAGESGKGFAVVADEVKQLAQQTAQATTSITDRVDRIAGGASEAVRSIAEMREVVGRIGDIATTISTAVEEQTATTGEISRSVAAVATAASSNTQVTAASAASVRELATMATSLNDLVARFRT